MSEEINGDTSQDDEKKRPNANYKLTISDDREPPPEGLTFYYNRARRLAKAPKLVQDLYKEPKKSRWGFFSVLVADKPRKILFLSIVILCVFIFIVGRIGLFDLTYILEGNKIEISGTVFEGTTIVILRKIARNNDAYTGAVDIAVSPPVTLAEDGSIPVGHPVFSHRIFFTLEKEETFRFVVPFEEPQLLSVLQTERHDLQLKFSPK